MARLAGKVAFITGAGTGIGRCTAELFAQEGARVAVADIAAATAEETAHRIAQASGQAIALHTDVTEPDSVQAGVRGAASETARPQHDRGRDQLRPESLGRAGALS